MLPSRLRWPVAAGLLALMPSSTRADERFDHRGSLGLLLGGGVLHEDSASVGGGGSSGFRGDVDLGGTLAIGHDGNELLLVGRLELGRGAPYDLCFFGGYRGYFAGIERLKTFVDLTAIVHVTPVLTAGPRAGVGVEYGFTPLLGVFGGIDIQANFGGTIGFAVAVFGGFQLRTYLLE